jgi:hypothetical protein
MPLLCKRLSFWIPAVVYSTGTLLLASGSASNLSANVPSSSGQKPTRSRRINTLPGKFLLFQNLFCCTGPASSAATYIFGTLSRGKVTSQLDPSSETLVFEKRSIRTPSRKTLPDFFLVAFLKRSRQMSEYYFHFCHDRFRPYTVTGGFVKQPSLHNLYCH